MEEDIEQYKSKLKELCKSGKRIKIDDMKNIYAFCELVENLIARYKELEELENITYETLKDTNFIHKNFIPKSKVKEKIEELKVKPNKFYSENKKFYYETDAYNKIIIQTLEEIIED